MNLSPRKSALPRLRTTSPQGSTRRKHTAGKPPEVDTMTHRAHLPRHEHRASKPPAFSRKYTLLPPPARHHGATMSTASTPPEASKGPPAQAHHAPGGKQGPARACSPRPRRWTPRRTACHASDIYQQSPPRPRTHNRAATRKETHATPPRRNAPRKSAAPCMTQNTTRHPLFFLAAPQALSYPYRNQAT